MQYRREIDGLRALAVLPVILFHAGFVAFSGGYVGVDVFFVISGYLITTILLSEMAAGSFSVVNFYERRARRILPALFVVAIACLPLAWMWLMPEDMKDFYQSLAALSVFSSNILFFKESGYFETEVELKPLLHTWSLAVEEQYYVLFPLLLLATRRLGNKAVVAVLAATALASLALAHWGSRNHPESTYFLLHTRAWELLIGSLIACRFSGNRPLDVDVQSREIAGLIGLALLLYAVFSFDSRTPYPSLYTLVPTAGTALIILFATPETSVGKLLGHRLFVGVGLISYSAYLWHQPLFAFARHRSLEEPDVGVFATLSVATLLLGFLSWRFVEQPFRDKRKFNRRTVFVVSGVGTAALLAVGLIGHVSDGHAKRAEARGLGDIEYRLRRNFGLARSCQGDGIYSAECRTGEDPEVLLWGDSFAMHLMPGLLASKPDLKVAQSTMSNCGPFFGVAPLDGSKLTPRWARDCIASNDKVLEWLKKNRSVKYVVLSSPFGKYAGEDARLMLRNGEIVSGRQHSLDYLRSTLDTIKGLGIVPVIFSPTPQTGKNIGRCTARAMWLDLPPDACSFSLGDAEKYQANVLPFLRRVEEMNTVVWLFDVICNQGGCRSIIGDHWIYRDSGHLSHEGSAYLGETMNFYQRLASPGGHFVGEP